MKYLISYDLHGDADHARVAEQFKDILKARHLHESVWLYETKGKKQPRETAESLVDLIKVFEGLGNSPSLLVTAIYTQSLSTCGRVLEPIN